MRYLRRFYRIVPSGVREFIKRHVILRLPESFFRQRLVSLNVPGLYAYYRVPYHKSRLQQAQKITDEKLTQPEQDLFICGLTDVYLRLDRGLVEVQGGKTLVESSFMSSRTLRVASMIGNPKSEKIPRFTGKTYATIITMFDRNYYHWFIDTLPRLSLFNALQLDESIALLMPDDLKPYQMASLNWCLPSNMTIEYVKDYNGVRVEKLLMPSYVRARTNLYVPIEHLDYVRSAVKRNINLTSPSAFGKRVYISRALASRRRVMNENEVIACLSKYDFTVLQAETMTLEEQVKCFRHVEYIVAPHGAGLTNMLFAERTTILELLGDMRPSSWHFQRLASTLGHQHHFLPAKQRGKDTDMHVNIGILEKKLVELGL